MSKAIDRVIDAVDGMPNLIKLVKGGKVDRVMRVVPLESRTLDLDTGPDGEEWEQVKRLIYLRAPVEKRGLDPVEVGTYKEWTLLPEQVPVVELTGEIGDDVKLNKKSREEKAHFKNIEEKRKPGRPKKAVKEEV